MLNKLCLMVNHSMDLGSKVIWIFGSSLSSGYGSDTIHLSYSKCDGHSGSGSFRSVDVYVKERSFKIASISTTIV